MKMIEVPKTPLTDEERLRLAQAAYQEYLGRCFWFMREDLIITKSNLPLIIEGLKLHGGHRGWKLAHALCR
jgi:hypothetical protein